LELKRKRKKELKQRRRGKKKKEKEGKWWGWGKGECKVRCTGFIIIVGMRGERKFSGQCLLVLLVRVG